jgi:hypothetical protein
MKKNKTIVESSKVAVDGSSLYYYNGRYILRVYVKYRIKSSNWKMELIFKKSFRKVNIGE